ncbi:MAG: flagellar export chaperone FliS [Deltaproteobacteria bacterium]|nr:flagellar export chaperone FliS [Deltaproteobacteria bacterium]
MTNPMKAYQRVRISTASPGELVVLLLEGLVRFTHKAATHLDEGAFVEAAQAIDRAIAIVTTLRESLDHKSAPAMSAQLDRTYVAWSQCLVHAQASSDVTAIRAIAEQMNDVAEGWRVVVRGQAGAGAVAP